MNTTSQQKSRGAGVILLVLLLTLILTLASAPADTQAAANAQPALLTLAAEQPDMAVRVIIQKGDTASDIKTFINQSGGAVIKDLPLINGIVAEMKAETAVALAQDTGVRWVSLDAPVMRSQVDTYTLRDNFNTAAYNNNDGSALWASDWAEYFDDGSPTGGYVKISDGTLRLSDDNMYLERAANLFGATSAALSFDYRIRSFDNSRDYVTVEISSDGGYYWTELERFAGSANMSSSQLASYDISAYAGEDTMIRFVTSYALGRRDIFYVDNLQINYEYAPQMTDVFVADDFEAIPYVYYNNSGTRYWSSAWQEIGENDGADSGDIQIIHWGDNQGLRFLENNLSAWRSADLSGASYATLNFDYALLYCESSDYVAVSVSNDGGLTWTELDQIQGPYTNTLTYFPASYDISDYISAETAVRFTTGFPDNDLVDVVYIDNVRISFDGVVSSQQPNYYLDTTNARQVWDMGYTGAGVTVAVIDSGITYDKDFSIDPANPDEFQSRVLTTQSFNADASTYRDSYGHGTHVAGIIGGNGAKSGGYYTGIAPDVNLIGLKVSDDQGMAYESDTVDALEWVLNNKDAYNIRVVNLSINSTQSQSYNDSPLNAAAEILWFNGIVVVASAGNYSMDAGFDSIDAAPANDPFIITVGASNESETPERYDDTVAPFSSRGTTSDGFVKPDVVAPGQDIISVLAASSWWQNEHPDRFTQGGYFRISGTSMSAPMVSGAAALLLQAEPNLTPDQVKYRLMNTGGYISGYLMPAAYPYLDVYDLIATPTTESANAGVVPHELLAKMALIAYWASVNGDESIDWENVDWDSVNWGSVDWDAVDWDSVNWGSVNWGSVNWGSVNWGSVNWGSVNWGSVNWGSVNWGSVNWGSVNWGSVNWGSVSWDD